MLDSELLLQIGQMVRILRGRDADKVAVIVALEQKRFVWVADGDKRRFDSPKKKNVTHLEAFDYVSTEVRDSIRDSGRVTNGKLRYAVNKFSEMLHAEEMKGE